MAWATPYMCVLKLKGQLDVLPNMTTFVRKKQLQNLLQKKEVELSCYIFINMLCTD